MDTYLNKRIARNPETVAGLIGTSLVIRTAFFVIGFGLVAAYAFVVNYSIQVFWILFIIGISILFQQYATVFRSALEGFERMHFIALADVFSKLFTTVVGITLLLHGSGVLLIATISIGASLISLGIQSYYFKQTQAIRLRFNRSLAVEMLRESTTYLSVLIFRTIYIQIDIIVISLLVNETVIGWYGAADSLFGTLLFVPSVLITAVFPALSRLFEENEEALKQLMHRSFILLLLLSVPIGLGLFAIADNVVVLLFGEEFVNSGPVLAIMGIVLIFTYQNMLIGRFLLATNRQRKWAVVMAVATLATIPLDLVLIPWSQQTFGNGAIGGALAFIVTESCMLIVGLNFLPKGSLNRKTLWMAARVVFIGLIMVLVVWQVRSIFLAIPVILGILVYGVLALMVGILTSDDLLLLKSWGMNFKYKIRRTQKLPG
jgi:O-antigen/teichoic acid export membrane protein